PASVIPISRSRSLALHETGRTPDAGRKPCRRRGHGKAAVAAAPDGRQEVIVRETARKTIRNTALLVAFEIANPLLSLVLIGTLSRRLEAEGLGEYNLLLNFFFVAQAFASLGLNTLITRDVSRDGRSAGRYLTTSLMLGLGDSVIGAAALELTIVASGYPAHLVGSGWLVAVSVVPSIMTLYIESIFIAFEKVQFIVYVAVVENTLKVFAGLWLLHSGFG